MSPVSDLRVPTSVRTDLRQAAEDAYPSEACGALLGHGDLVMEICPLPNRSSAPGHSYDIGPSDLEPLMRVATPDGPSVIGFYHSHPDADPEPSRLDLELACPGYWYMIVGVRGGTATSQAVWRLADA